MAVNHVFITLLVVGLLHSLPTLACTPGGSPPCAQLSLGSVVGNEFPAASGALSRNFEFLGMRYAAPSPPRWGAASPPQPWSGDLDATAFGNFCPQLLGSAQIVIGAEDCLFINVWTNALPNVNGSGQPAPVFLWTYGGSFISGGSSFGFYNGRNLVRDHENLVVVSYDYRLGPLGFLALPALRTTMLFMEDQRMAFQWVQTHIAAFGGDPNRITLLGQSAGGDSVCLHSFSPPSQGLYHALAIESGDCGQWYCNSIVDLT